MSTETSTWRSQTGYIWSLIGSAVGFANILSFSAKAYNNGGGAFMIPYFAALFVLGIPMLMLEGIIGYTWKKPVVSAYGVVWGKWGKMIGWLAVIACLTIGAFYIVLTGYSVAYAYFAATEQIPSDTQTFFLSSFLHITPSIGDFGTLSIPIALSTLGAAFVAWMVLVRNVKDGIERICTIFMPFLGVIIFAFALIVCFLPGGINGVYYYLTPDFSKLWEPALWRDIFGQLFFSLSLGLGIIIGYSRHTGKTTNIAKAMLWVAIGDFAVSFLAGLAIFGCLAHISFLQGVPFNEILKSDSTFEIGFILFPQILKFFGPLLAQLVGTLFFFCVFIAGITGVFSIVESIAGNVEVEFGFSRKKAVTCSMAALVALSLPFCMGNASHILEALAPMVLGINMLIGGLASIICFYFYSKEVRHHTYWNDSILSRFFAFSLKIVAPTLLIVILISVISQEFLSFDITKTLRWSWFAAALLFSTGLSRCVFTQKEKPLQSIVLAEQLQ